MPHAQPGQAVDGSNIDDNRQRDVPNVNESSAPVSGGWVVNGETRPSRGPSQVNNVSSDFVNSFIDGPYADGEVSELG